jgi:MoaA/NifB/PqqE/SkfB family radical SAM enzyme
MSRLDFLLVEPTNNCGLRCPLCPTGLGRGGRPKGQLDLSALEAILADPAVDGPAVLLWGWGEPTLHPKLADLVRSARQHGCSVEVQSNGHGPRAVYEDLIEAGLDTLTIALDGLDDTQVRPLRGPSASADRVRQLLQHLASRREGTELQVQCLATALNEPVLDELRAWVEALPARFSLKSLNTTGGSPELAELLTPRRESLRRPLPRRVRTDRPPCTFLSSGAALLWDGTVVPCCYDWLGEHALGTAVEGWAALAARRARFPWQTARMCEDCTMMPSTMRDPFGVLAQ